MKNYDAVNLDNEDPEKITQFIVERKERASIVLWTPYTTRENDDGHENVM